jgi:hypothetical protein
MTPVLLLLPWCDRSGPAAAEATAAAVRERAEWLIPRPIAVTPTGSGPAALALAGLGQAGASPSLVWSGVTALDPCHLHAELLLWRTGPAALAGDSCTDLPWEALQRHLTLPTWHEGLPPSHDLSLIWAPDASALAALWNDTACLIAPLLTYLDTDAVLKAAFPLTLQRLAPQRILDRGMCQLPLGLCPGLSPEVTPEPMALSAAIWQSENPREALHLLASAALTGSAPPGVTAMSQAVEAAAMLRDPYLVNALWQRLEEMQPSPWLWGMRLRLWLASDSTLAWPEWAGDAPLSLPASLPEADRLLLTQALQTGRLQHTGMLSSVLAELPKPQRLLHRLRQGDTTDELMAGLVQQITSLSQDRQDAAQQCYATTPRSLRHPAFPWFSAEAADRDQLSEIVDQITVALNHQEGFSLMRLGDGEALLLDGERICLGGATSNGQISTDRLTTEGQLPPDELERLVAQFLEAVEAASVVGIPDLGQCLDGPKHYGLVAATLVQRLSTDRFEALAPRLLPGGCHLHLFLLAQGAFSRAPLLDVHGVIGPVIPAGLATRSCWQPIPGEKGKHPLSSGPAHYPQVFDETLTWIDREARPGRLFLVGAGLLGKIYCHAIQKRGGVAIDVGSVLDLCDGRGATRGESRLQPFLLRQAEQAFRQTGASG